MRRYEEPFLHFVKDDFLSLADADAVREVHGKCAFRELHTDLFKFLQTGELRARDDLDPFRKSLMKTFEEIEDVEGGWLDVFGSYYRAGDYLLCHDDKTGNRRFAFSYYLEDHDSGELILYKSDCVSVSKKVSVRSNRLVIFEVSGVSFHEVGYCERDGRRAFTGWLNLEHVRHEDDNGSSELHCPSAYDSFPLEVDLDKDPFVFYPDVDYDFGEGSGEVEGPFYARRVERVAMDGLLVPVLDGWRLVDASIYRFRPGDYVLLNDKCNGVEGDVCDVFFIGGDGCLGGEQIGAFDDASNPIKYMDRDGRFVCGIPICKGMFAVRRGGLSLFVERSKTTFLLAHFMYVADNPEQE